ncbi:MAG: hypothetical protein UX61_C0024G0006 [Parcubacteria group bacterium GW2011_GWA2_46_7]|nr:MAG: hypothetical protein UX15_C0040G0011 [Parcubacteria group bacterium GW2011_GWA1_45_7]KKU10725.1 MAG: hypothetical protein UX14_C0010G0008 [Parcubacteria group bacterium GW2011_GWF1_45_5]KKU43302.1 MAG: hypothetical protein UX61_C0024G0006 [Parcubacteria group bacterium GW2011_GWA2_46_7]KKU46940.1 MAG: hypothetical protein UX66_C0029G0007 [Parcubacteria group bacterium GW2011_GWF2_46_8]OHD12195.1 MAG: hypothetical protein A2Z96_03545 [Spirochaetes bacterium GWB1_48_6]
MADFLIESGRSQRHLCGILKKIPKPRADDQLLSKYGVSNCTCGPGSQKCDFWMFFDVPGTGEGPMSRQVVTVNAKAIEGGVKVTMHCPRAVTDPAGAEAFVEGVITRSLAPKQ